MGMQVTNLNTFLHLFKRRILIWSPVIFSDSASRNAVCAVQAPAVSKNSLWIPHSWIFLYASKYRVQCNDASPCGVLCYSDLNFAIGIPNKHESVFGSVGFVANKNS